MSRVEKIAQNKLVRNALSYLDGQVEEVLNTAIAVQQIPAPTFAEAQRANYVQSRFTVVGLSDVAQDDLHNVYGRFPAVPTRQRPPVILSAHMDTVFPSGTDLAVKRNGRYVYGPGLGDNSTGIAGLVHLAQTLFSSQLRLPADVWFVANVGEEGLGDLRGMRAVVDHFGPEAVYVVVEGGLYGQISHQAIGVRRFRVEIDAQGGHSWGNFGRASAIHILGRLIAAIDNLKVPVDPKTTYNVGIVEGGTSINTIAATASMLLDLRSEDPAELDKLVGAVKDIVHAVQGQAIQDGRSDIKISISQIGSRPAGSIPRQTPLVTWAESALRFVGCERINYIAGSTDANVPLSEGITAVCIGLTESGNAHRQDEYIDLTNLTKGMSQLLLVTLAAAGLETKS